MKKLALVFTAVFLAGATVSAKTTNALEDNSSTNLAKRGYGNSFIFTEGGIEFSVFPDGQFDFYAPNYGPDVNVSINTPNVSFSFNSGYDYGPYLQYDDFGAIIQIENTPIYYDYYGRVTQIGNVNINYTHYGRVAQVGGLYVHYNSHRVFTHYTGFINVYNRVYVYQPWHVHYIVPPPSYCVVYARPYRQYYTPVRHHYYRPYVDNHRQPVRYAYSNGRRGETIGTSRFSDRYRQDATSVGSNVRSMRDGNARSLSSNATSRSQRGSSVASSRNLTEGTSRQNATRSNERTLQSNRSTRTQRADVQGHNTRSMTQQGDRSQRNAQASQGRSERVMTQRDNSSQRNVQAQQGRNERVATQRGNSSQRTMQTTQRNNVNGNTNAVGRSSERVKSLPNRKPSAANTRISTRQQQQKTVSQRSNSGSMKQQSTGRSASRRGN